MLPKHEAYSSSITEWDGRRLFLKNWRSVFPKCFGGVCFHCEASASNGPRNGHIQEEKLAYVRFKTSKLLKILIFCSLWGRGKSLKWENPLCFHIKVKSSYRWKIEIQFHKSI